MDMTSFATDRRHRSPKRQISGRREPRVLRWRSLCTIGRQEHAAALCANFVTISDCQRQSSLPNTKVEGNQG